MRVIHGNMLPDEKFTIGISLGHDASVSLLCGGELLALYVEERFSGNKYDSLPLLALQSIINDHLSLKTKGVDQVIVTHTYGGGDGGSNRTLVGYDLFAHLLHKHQIPVREMIHVHDIHHYFHALVAFFRSGLQEAAVVVADGCGSVRFKKGKHDFENYTIFNFSRKKLLRVNNRLKQLYKKYTLQNFEEKYKGAVDPLVRDLNKLDIKSGTAPGVNTYSNVTEYHQLLGDQYALDGILLKERGSYDPQRDFITKYFLELENILQDVVEHTNMSASADLTYNMYDTLHHVKLYEGVVKEMGWYQLEAGKLMGLAPYGQKDASIPNLFEKVKGEDFTYRSKHGMFDVAYPGSSSIQWNHPSWPTNGSDLIKDHSSSFARNLAYKVQQQTQKINLNLLLKAHLLTNQKNIVLTGGYAMNCSANYFYLEEMNKHGLKLFVEPISNDQGTSLGAAIHGSLSSDNYDNMLCNAKNTLYFGPKLKQEDVKTRLFFHINEIDQQYPDVIGIKENAIYEDIINLIEEGNIVALWQGSSEGGQRALGNRSLLFDPRRPNGKDEVNVVKQREFFRPFAGTILEEDVHDWFDMRGMKNSPFMMYAVNCRQEKKHLIPSIVHVDGTCRIQTVTKEQNYHFYNLIKTFKDRTKVPILFNTSFNLAGAPLVENLSNALITLMCSDIKYLYVPELQILLHIPIKLENKEKK